MGQGADQSRNLGMGLWIIPANTFLTFEHGITVIADLTRNKVNDLVDSEFKPVSEADTAPDDGRTPTGRVEM
jgi:hypothetical protein